MIEKILESFGGLFELHGTATFHEDCSSHVAESCIIVDEVLHIVEATHIHGILLGVSHTPCLESLAEFLAHKHYHVEHDAGSEEEIEDDAMLLLRLVTQFAHVAEDHALMRCIVHLER